MAGTRCKKCGKPNQCDHSLHAQVVLPTLIEALQLADAAIVDAMKTGFRGGREARMAIADAVREATTVPAHST